MKNILIISADRKRQEGRGKLKRDFFVPIFENACARRGIAVQYMSSPARFIFGPTIPNVVGIIPIYNEELIPPNRSSWSTRTAVDLMEKRARASYPSTSFAHPLRIGNILGDKSACHTALSAAGVPMPRLADGTDGNPVISLARRGSGENVSLHMEKKADADRHNVEFIDTRHDYCGDLYRVCIRAMCVGPEIAGLFVRARPAYDGLSVHAADTPQDAGLLNHLHEKIVKPRRVIIQTLCQAAGRRLGIGFYAHDLLPEVGSERVLLCESGIKFDDVTIRNRLKPIIGDLTFASDFLETSIQRAADLYVDQVDRCGAADPVDTLMANGFEVPAH